MNQNTPIGTPALVSAILASVEGTDWPASAEYMVEYRTKCWPCQMGDQFKRYFDTEAEMQIWLAKQAEWASQEGNSMDYSIYQWELGPQYMNSSFY